MKVIKRDGTEEVVSFDKVITRIKFLCDGTSKSGEYIGSPLDIDPVTVAQKVINEIRDGITTCELDEFAAKTAASMLLDHPDYGILSGRIIVSNHHKNTLNSFTDTVKLLYENKDINGAPSPLIDRQTYKIALHYRTSIQEKINYLRDYNFDYFGFKTLEKSYLIHHQTGTWKVLERPQHMYMRVAIGIHGENLEKIFETYDLMSQGYFTHATPTLFNAGTPKPQLSSCFLMGIDDNMDSIYQTLKNCANISKWAGGIGLHISNIRAKGSLIRGTNGKSNGIVPMLKVFNDTARYVDQGGGKRMGSFAIYLEPWHAEVMDFLDLRKATGKEELRARDLFYAMWIPDLFMKRLEIANENPEKVIQWSLFCPDECPGLSDTYGDEFEKLYLKYENEGRARKRIDIINVWKAILTSQKETGTPYLLFKDHANRKSNQKNLGTIKSSNLCAEIIEYSNSEETAVCNLASIALPKYVSTDEQGNLFFDHNRLYEVVKVVTRNLDQIIDINYYPTPETKKSNLRHRPLGIGVQGLADTFIQLRLPFDSEGAARLNEEIFETIYFGAMSQSYELAQEFGAYESFPGSPISQGLFQFDLWDHQPVSGRWDWETLRTNIQKDGVHNSLTVALMPTASTAQILGNNEAFEPFTYNVYVRRVLAGEFTIVNKHMHRDLVKLGLWTPELRKKIITRRGSVQGISEIPDELQQLYKTAFELKQRVLIDMAVSRGRFVDQSQSLNLFLSSPDDKKLTAMHLYSWKQGLKTGIYYLRREPIKHAQQFTVVPTKREQKSIEEPKLCKLNDPDCLACGS